MKHYYKLLTLLLLFLTVGMQGMQQARRALYANPALRTRLVQPTIKKIGVHQSFNAAKQVTYQAPRQSWFKRITKWGAGSAVAATATTGAAAHYIHSLPDEKRYPTVSKILDYSPVQTALHWFPNFGRKLAAYWRTNGVVQSFEQEMKESDIDPAIKFECINKWPKECQETISYSDYHIMMCKP